MSLDYTYTHGYGFFIHRQDLEKAGVKESSSVYEDAFNYLETLTFGHLLKAVPASSSMRSGPEKVFIAVARTLVTGDAKAPEHTEESPAEYEDMEDFATADELHLLDVFAFQCDSTNTVPKIRFYITID